MQIVYYPLELRAKVTPSMTISMCMSHCYGKMGKLQQWHRKYNFLNFDFQMHQVKMKFRFFLQSPIINHPGARTCFVASPLVLHNEPIIIIMNLFIWIMHARVYTPEIDGIPRKISSASYIYHLQREMPLVHLLVFIFQSYILIPMTSFTSLGRKQKIHD